MRERCQALCEGQIIWEQLSHIYVFQRLDADDQFSWDEDYTVGHLVWRFGLFPISFRLGSADGSGAPELDSVVGRAPTDAGDLEKIGRAPAVADVTGKSGILARLLSRRW